MSIYRQLMLAIVLSSIIALLGSLTVTTLNTRNYFVDQLRLKNQDNASSLALSLSQSGLDAVGAKLTVAAQFDSGNYALVRFTDAQGRVAVEKKELELIEGVPRWFLKLVPMQVPPGVAKVTNGWRQLGSVTLMSHAEYAYVALWKSVQKMALIMLLTTLLGCGLGLLILQRIKKSLDQVVDQANSITHKRFITIPEPKEPELRKVTSAMNYTVGRLKEMFEEEAARLDVLRREVNYDGVTGMLNRGSFMTRLKEVLHTEESAFGSCMILRIANLAEINKKYGRVETDRIISKIGANILNHSQQMPEVLSGRLNGSDFGMLIQSENPKASAEALMRDIVRDVGEFFEDGFCASLGMSQYFKGIALPSLLSKIDIALAAAEVAKANAVVVSDDYEDSETPTTMEAWSSLLRNALNEQLMCLLSFPVADFSGKVVHQEGPLRIRSTPDASWIPAGKFFPVAERLGFTSDLDLSSIALGINAMLLTPKHPGYSINVSASSLLSPGFTPRVKQLIHTHPKLARKLSLEFPETGVFRHYLEFKEFCLSMKETHVSIGIEHFGREFDQMGRLHELGIGFLKVDASYVRDLDKNSGNQAFLRGLAMMAHGIGLKVYAEGVLSEAEMKALNEAGFDGATGPAVKPG